MEAVVVKRRFILLLGQTCLYLFDHTRYENPNLTREQKCEVYIVSCSKCFVKIVQSVTSIKKCTRPNKVYGYVIFGKISFIEITLTIPTQLANNI